MENNTSKNTNELGNLGGAIEQLIKDCTHTRGEITALIGIGEPYLSMIISNQRVPALTILQKIASVLDTNICALLARAKQIEKGTSKLNTYKAIEVLSTDLYSKETNS